MKMLISAPAKDNSRISSIEGLRAYLSIWVVVGHVLGSSGYADESLLGALTRVLRSGWLAVHIFIIISGFVIFNLIDRSGDNYLQYIVKRFFRLWPIFITAFFLGIVTNHWSDENAIKMVSFYPDISINADAVLKENQTMRDNILAHVLLHIPMLHGIIPHAILPSSPNAFLAPAWSISLEWQFYLIAPFIFRLISSSKASITTAVSLMTLLVLVASRKLPFIEYGAFLPMHAHYFYIGCVSYFVISHEVFKKVKINLSIIGFVLASFVYIISGLKDQMIPICFWFFFMGLLLDSKSDYQTALSAGIIKIFDNAFVRYLGRISYGVYLVHTLAIITIQKALLIFVPALTQREHFCVLLLCVLVMTVIISHFLHYWLEIPAISFGRKISAKLCKRV
jgi:peptidoglycan/LPS O-acetylase OafA/YrhL